MALSFHLCVGCILPFPSRCPSLWLPRLRLPSLLMDWLLSLWGLSALALSCQVCWVGPHSSSTSSCWFGSHPSSPSRRCGVVLLLHFLVVLGWVTPFSSSSPSQCFTSPCRRCGVGGHAPPPPWRHFVLYCTLHHHVGLGRTCCHCGRCVGCTHLVNGLYVLFLGYGCCCWAIHVV